MVIRQTEVNGVVVMLSTVEQAFMVGGPRFIMGYRVDWVGVGIDGGSSLIGYPANDRLYFDNIVWGFKLGVTPQNYRQN